MRIERLHLWWTLQTDAARLWPMFPPNTISITHYDRSQIPVQHGEPAGPFVSLLLTFADAHLNKLIGNTCKLQWKGGGVMEGFFGGRAESFKLSIKEPWGEIRPSVLTNEPRGTERCALVMTPPHTLLTSHLNFHDCCKNISVFLGSGPTFLPTEEAERRPASCQRWRVSSLQVQS